MCKTILIAHIRFKSYMQQNRRYLYTVFSIHWSNNLSLVLIRSPTNAARAPEFGPRTRSKEPTGTRIISASSTLDSVPLPAAIYLCLPSIPSFRPHFRFVTGCSRARALYGRTSNFPRSSREPFAGIFALAPRRRRTGPFAWFPPRPRDKSPRQWRQIAAVSARFYPGALINCLALRAFALTRVHAYTHTRTHTHACVYLLTFWE